jgi:cyclopropane-fatty-acyl-phospholipid synthase
MTTEGASQQAIESHYDVGGDFYQLWLGPTRVYSCALWPDDDPSRADRANHPLGDDLDAAQLAKLAWHADSAGAGPGRRVLDVGCGWGAMLRHVALDRGAAAAVGLTLSSDQADFVGALALPGVEVRLEDWREHEPVAPYDAIISIGAFEHFCRVGLSVDERRAVYRSFFERCARWLTPGGGLSLQSIAYESLEVADGPVRTFFADQVFPESELPRLSDIVAGSEETFVVRALRSDGRQYEHTLALWQRRLEAAKDAATDLVGRDTYRHYLRYLRLSRAMFDRGVCTLYRISFTRRPDLG